MPRINKKSSKLFTIYIYNYSQCVKSIISFFTPIGWYFLNLFYLPVEYPIKNALSNKKKTKFNHNQTYQKKLYVIQRKKKSRLENFFQFFRRF